MPYTGSLPIQELFELFPGALVTELVQQLPQVLALHCRGGEGQHEVVTGLPQLLDIGVQGVQGALLRWTFALRTYVRMRTFPVKWFPLCPHLKKKGRIAQLGHWPEVLLLILAVALHWKRSNTNN